MCDYFVYIDTAGSDGFAMNESFTSEYIDFDVPDIMQKNLVKYLNKGNYSDSVGDLSVRENIARYEIILNIIISS